MAQWLLLFAQPTGTSSCEEGALIHHCLIGGVDMLALVVCHYHRGGGDLQDLTVSMATAIENALAGQSSHKSPKSLQCVHLLTTQTVSESSIRKSRDKQ